MFRPTTANSLFARPTARAGVTLVEVLTVIGVVSVLVGLLLPAVQKVRAAAARTACANRVKQLALAGHNYEQAHGAIPMSFCKAYPVPPRTRCFSPQAALLPFLELGAVADAVDWADTSADAPGGTVAANPANTAVLSQTLRPFICPADGEAGPGSLSYRQSLGWDLLVGGRDPLRDKLVAARDGLSHTAYFSERLVGAKGDNGQRNAAVIGAAPWVLAAACVKAQEAGPLVGSDPHVGHNWLADSGRHATYTHAFPPNSRLCDCETGFGTSLAVMTARSHHAGGVNVAFLDGHVRFVTNDIAATVWRAWATPSGGEVAE